MAKAAFIYPGYENLGVEALAAALKKAGHQARLFLDPILFAESGCVSSRFLKKIFCFERDIIRRLKTYAPDFVCFSVLSDNYQWAIRWANLIKAELGTPVVFGGIHPTAVPEMVIKENVVDYVCVGEGDQAIVELAGHIANRRSGLTIKNIWGKKEGEIIKNDVRPLIADLDALPFADKSFFYFTAPVFHDGYLISTSRGCPYQCSFCCNSVIRKIYEGTDGNFVRRRSREHVLGELRQAKRIYRPSFIAFVDDTFNFTFEWEEPFLKSYKKEINLPFSCYLSLQGITEYLAGLLKECGCFKVQIGVQNIDERMRRDVLKRNYTNKQISAAIGLFKTRAIFLVCDNILGMGRGANSGLLKLGRFYNEHMPSMIEMFWLRYYPRTQITEKAREEGLLSEDRYEKIMKGEISCGIAKGGDHASGNGRRIQLMLNLFHFFPRWLREKLLNGWYRFLPPLAPVHQLLLFRMLFYWFHKESAFDMYRARTFARYRFFGIRKMRLLFERNFPGKALRKIPLIYRLGFKRLTFRKIWLIGRYLVKTAIFRRQCPGAVIIGLTYSCQCACGHCSVAGHADGKRRELGRDSIKKLIKDIVSMGVPKINFFGGEPLMCAELVEYVKFAAARGVSVSVDTNACALDRKLIKVLKKAGINNINISLDSVVPAVHDALRGVPGLFDKVIRAVTDCAAEKVPCVVSTYASHRSIRSGDLEGIIGLAETLGAAAVKILFPMLSGNWRDSEEELLSEEEKKCVMNLLDPGFSYLESPLFSTKKGRKVCEALRKKIIYVSPYGEVQPCYAIPLSFGSVLDKPLPELVKTMWAAAMFLKCPDDCAINDKRLREKLKPRGAAVEMPSLPERAVKQ